jgi:ribosomal protein S18 acetylase RimI-like enzyme
MIEMLSVKTPDHIETTATLAREIWIQHYIPIIGQAQVDYMLCKRQSVQAIAQQISDGYEYYLATDCGALVGYFAIIPNPAEHTALLSKIYVIQEGRGTGLGKAMVTFIEKRCAEMGVRELWLTVNKHNSDSIAFYQRMGFTTTESLVQDIGNDFVMDDYRMAKQIAATAPCE